jgi:hypothetical protein
MINEDGIEVGMTGAFSIGSDYHPYKVTSVTAKTFGAVRLHPGKNKVQWPNQDYEIDLNQDLTNAHEYRVRKTSRGFSSRGFSFSKPEYHTAEQLGTFEYLDPSF